ncbi:MAG: Vms1/Ankzf1 family peptidyl-tRNA hydrolase, partial [bacterium]|nr:Vms1/Ankzf1 family peptidyl-tRNA hydrolase [bacterium]
FRTLIHGADRLIQRPTSAERALARERLEEAVGGMLEFLDAEVATRSTVRGVALFVSLAPAKDHDPRTPAFTAFTLPRPVRNQAHVERRPHIRPLLFLLDQYERVGVIVADRNHARIFTLFLGEIEEIRHRKVDTPRRHHQGGWKQMLFQRDVDGHIKAHIRTTVREAVNLFGRDRLKRIVLGGSDETLALIKNELPPAFGPLIAGTFLAEPHASDTELATKALALAHAAEVQEEQRRVQELLDDLAHRSTFVRGPNHPAAVSGTRETLRALSEHRVRRLLMSRGFRTPGSVCDNCSALSADLQGACASCGFPLRPVPDVLEHAVESARDQSAEVEFVTESPSLAALGGVGALLRF